MTRCAQRYVTCPHRNLRHGTESTYKHHGCRCDPCRAENVRKNLEGRIRRRDQMRAGEVSPPHGSESTYFNYMCRCKPCIEAHRIRQRERRW